MTTNLGNQFEALEIIGRGSFGTVRKVRRKEDGLIVVRKEMEYQAMNARERTQLVAEFRILRELNHPNIVSYYSHDSLPEQKMLHLYMEYCDGGDMSAIIKQFKDDREYIPEQFVWSVLVQMLLALHRCHYGRDVARCELFAHGPAPAHVDAAKVIIHRDIKPDNIFLTNNSETVKLGDFGLAKMLNSQQEFAKTYVGTPYYMSPEVLVDAPYSPVCDIWSLGCVIYEMCTLHPPFQAKTHLQLQAKIKEGGYPDVSGRYSTELRNLIRACITVDPAARPTTRDLLDNLSVKFIRKEMELKALEAKLQGRERRLEAAEGEMDARASELDARAREVEARDATVQESRASLAAREQDAQRRESQLHADLQSRLVKKFAADLENLKRTVEEEARSDRLKYQKEFDFVVEHTVRKEIERLLSSQGNLKGYLSKHGVQSPPGQNYQAAYQSPRRVNVQDPRDRTNSQGQDLRDRAQFDRTPAPRANTQPVTRLKGPRELGERAPLRNLNADLEYPNYPHSPEMLKHKFMEQSPTYSVSSFATAKEYLDRSEHGYSSDDDRSEVLYTGPGGLRKY